MSHRPLSRSAKRAPSRILLVDDHPMIRERLAEVIQREADLVVCGEAEDVHAALSAVERLHPDLAIVDLTLKDSYGMDLIKDLRIRHPALAVLVVSMHEESLHAERVIRAGARGYITKQEATKNILIAIRTVLAGDLYLSGKAALHVASKVATATPARGARSFDKLSDRELRVLELIGKGHGTRQIADRLRLGVPTVETYRARIKDKLNLRDASELLQYAIRWSQSGGSR
jgi:DNA-binding NarL/FixJ family response regulator